MRVTQVERNFHLFDRICWTSRKAWNKLTMLFSNKLERYKTLLSISNKRSLVINIPSFYQYLTMKKSFTKLYKNVRRKFECFFKLLPNKFISDEKHWPLWLIPTIMFQVPIIFIYYRLFDTTCSRNSFPILIYFCIKPNEFKSQKQICWQITEFFDEILIIGRQNIDFILTQTGCGLVKQKLNLPVV